MQWKRCEARPRYKSLGTCPYLILLRNQSNFAHSPLPLTPKDIKKNIPSREKFQKYVAMSMSGERIMVLTAEELEPVDKLKEAHSALKSLDPTQMIIMKGPSN